MGWGVIGYGGCCCGVGDRYIVLVRMSYLSTLGWSVVKYILDESVPRLGMFASCKAFIYILTTIYTSCEFFNSMFGAFDDIEYVCCSGYSQIFSLLTTCCRL